MTSLKYLPLLGRYVRMERLSPEDIEGPVSLEGIVAMVEDVGLGVVTIVFEDGTGYNVFPTDEWRFKVITDEETAGTFLPYVRAGLRRKAEYRRNRERRGLTV